MSHPFSVAAIGIDVAKDKLDVVLLAAEPGTKPRHQVFANTPSGHDHMQDWLTAQQAGGRPVCLEATGRYSEPIALFLHERAWTVQVVNPARIKKFGESELLRLKTDKSDAALIARFSLAQHPLSWTPAPVAQRQLQDVVRAREDLQGLRQQESNRLASAPLLDAVHQAHQAVIKAIDEQLQHLDEQITQHLQQHPDLQKTFDLLVSIPGIAAKTASVLLSAFGDFSRFDSSRQVVAVVGLAPAARQSGSSLHAPSHLCKTGRADLRKALYYPAISACRFNPLVRTFYQRLLAAGKPKMVALLAAMHKLLVLIYAVVRSGKPFDPLYQHPRQQELEALAV